MKLTKKHIGGLFDVKGSDGSWVYQLVDIRKGKLLFYAFGGWEITSQRKYNDWTVFKPVKRWTKRQIKYGWETGRKQ